MARKPDKPGEHRKRHQSDGWWRVSGMKLDGTRVKVQRFATEAEADAYISRSFKATQYDDWGMPVTPLPTPDSMRMSPEQTASVNANLGVPPMPAPPTATEEEQKRKKKMAMGLADLAGTAWATGTMVVSRRLTDSAGKVPVNPDPKQVQGLADATKETIQGWFGDREIKPWQMMILLTLGIPVVMLIQSPPKKPEQLEAEKASKLKSVP